MVKVWDLTSREEVWQNQAHEGIVKGLVWSKAEQKLITCASDKTCKVFDPYNSSSRSLPLATYLGNTSFTSVSHHRSLPNFAASSDQISIYDLARSSGTPIQTMRWPSSENTIQQVSFNQTETSILASCGTDRSVCILPAGSLLFQHSILRNTDFPRISKTYWMMPITMFECNTDADS